MTSTENQENVAPAEKPVKSIVTQIARKLNETRNEIMQRLEKGRKNVLERSLLSLAVVFVLGLAIAVVIGKSRQDS
jgi:hypothetical protein